MGELNQHANSINGQICIKKRSPMNRFPVVRVEHAKLRHCGIKLFPEMILTYVR